MSSRFVAVLLSALLAATLGLSARAADTDWPQWRGPNATGASTTANPPTKWSETENIKWKVRIPGRGSGSPIVWGDKIFIQTAIVKANAAAIHFVPADTFFAQQQRRGGGGRGGASQQLHEFALLCIDRNTGKTLWHKAAREEIPHEGHHQDHGYSSFSPITDGAHVYASFGSRGVFCFDMEGNLKWQKDFGDMQTKNGFGEASSPALADGVLVVLWDHEGADAIIGLDAKTGNELWRAAREEDTTWTTPLIVEHDGQKQVITNATRKIRSYDLKSGKLLWEHAGLTPNSIPSPVSADGIVYAMAGFRGNALYAIRLGKTGDLTKTDAVLWSHAKSTPYVPSPLLYNNRLYFFASNNGILSIFDAKSGKPLVDAQRLDDIRNIYSSPVAAAGRVYVTARDGTTAVLKDSDKVEVLSVNKLSEPIDASAAPVGNQLILRGAEHLYCIAEK